MNIRMIQNVPNLVIALEGRLDTNTSPELESVLMPQLEEAQSLVIDAEKLEYVSSAGLRVLLAAHKAMSGKGGMKVRNVCDLVMEVFDVTGFTDIFSIE